MTTRTLVKIGTALATLGALGLFLVAPTSVHAYFNVHVSGLGTGSGTITAPAGTGDGISCGTNCSEQYANNATVTVSQSAAPGSTFSGWGGDCSGTGACSVTSAGTSKNVTATFTAATCVRNPRADLRYPNGSALPVGTGNLPASISVKNFSPNCTYSLHMASYKVFSPWEAGSGTTFLATQRLHNDASVSIGPGATQTVSAGVPSCRYQTDLFEGPSAPASNPDFAQMPAYTVFDWKFASSLPLCGPKLTVVKTVVNNNGGTKTVADFLLRVGSTLVTSGVSTSFPAGTYTVSETSLPGYTAGVWGGDCTLGGSVTLTGEQNKTCTITNDDTATTPVTCTGPTTGQTGQSYTFTGHGGSAYTWRVSPTTGFTPTGSSGTGGTVTKTFSTPGNKAITFATSATAFGNCNITISATQPPVNGTCQTPPNGGTYPTAPTGTLCSIGTPTSIAGTGPWTWSCVGSNNGTTASCSANKTGVPPVLTCSPERQQKGVLVPATINAGGTTGVYTWNIVGSQTITCDAGVTPCSPAFPQEGEKTVRLTDGVTVSCYVDVVGSVKVTSNVPTSWSLSRPNGEPVINETNVRTKTYASQRPGSYILDVTGPTPVGFKPNPTIEPVGGALTIPQEGADIEFTITYTPVEPPCTGDNCSPCTGDNCPPPPDPNMPPACSDAQYWVTKGDPRRGDNDTDTFYDAADPGCWSMPDGTYNSSDPDESNQYPECSDDIDNADPEDKNNPLADIEDPGCHTDGNVNNPDSYQPKDDDETDEPLGAVTQCNNGLDDDGDGKIDFEKVTPPTKEADPGCASELDPSELDDPIIEEI